MTLRSPPARVSPAPARGAAHPSRQAGALLKLGYRCNCRCLFCHSAPHRGVDLSSEEARGRIALAASAGVERIVLSGGEPTIRPDVAALVADIAARGLVPGLVTNGRMLAYRGLRETLVASGLGQLYLSLHSHRAEVHDALVQASGAHRQTVTALRWAAAEPRLDLLVNAVVTRRSLRELGGLVRLVTRLARAGGRAQPKRVPIRLKLSLVEPEGETLALFDELVPTLPEAAAEVSGVLGELTQHAAEGGVDLRVDGFPPCQLPAAVHRAADLWTEGFVYLMEAFEDRLHLIDDLAMARGRPCRRCSADGCPGIYRTYLERRGDEELVPLSVPRGSAVDFAAVHAVGSLDPRRCPCFAGRRAHPDPRRELLVRVGGRTRLHRCTAVDFAERELYRIVREWGQVYRALDPGEQAEDFARSLGKLRPAAACERCPHRGACGALWLPEGRDVMAGDEEEVRSRIAELEGRVLDLGCGAAAYLAPLAAAVARGRVELHLLDPDPEAASALRVGHIPHRFHQGRVEELRSEWGLFDHVLALRSYSHFTDVDRAADAIARILRPGGRLTVVGDTPVALARSRAASARGRRREDLGLEHFHNHGPDQAWALFEEHPFEVIRMAAPRVRGSNLWFLDLVRH